MLSGDDHTSQCYHPRALPASGHRHSDQFPLELHCSLHERIDHRKQQLAADRLDKNEHMYYTLTVQVALSKLTP